MGDRIAAEPDTKSPDPASTRRSSLYVEAGLSDDPYTPFGTPLMFMLAAFLLSVQSGCRTEDALYALRGKPVVTASFRSVEDGREWSANVALAIRFGDTGRTYWWLPWNGGTDDRQHVASTTDVTDPSWRAPSPDTGNRLLGNMEYIGTDAHYDIIDDIPRRGGVAPAHMLFPSLGDTAWHHDVRQRDSAPKQFFDLVGCDTNGDARRSAKARD